MNIKIQSYLLSNNSGLNHDNDIIYQSQRFDHYIDKIEELLNNDMAYYDKVEVNDKTKETNLSIQYENRLNEKAMSLDLKIKEKVRFTLTILFMEK